MVKVALVIMALAISGYFVFENRRVPRPPPAQGHCTPRFKAIEKIYRENFENRVESGSAFAVYHRGELVCDLWGGWADQFTKLPWSEETMPIVFSTTKGVTAITMALLCDRGYCDYDKLVTEYWPEFGQKGKANITLGMLLSHQGGLAAIEETITLDMLEEDPDEVGRIIAAQKPNWPPGSASGYHAISFGVVVDQLIRRIDPEHRSLDQYFREEIAEPYDIDFFIGAPLSEHWRIARQEHPTLLGSIWDCLHDSNAVKFVYKIIMADDPILNRAITNPEYPLDKLNWPKIRSIPQGSFNGYGTARALARLFSLVAAADKHEALDDAPPLLSPKAVKKLYTSLHSGVDRMHGIHYSKGPGVFITENIDGKGGVSFHHAGQGTQLAMGIAKSEVSFSYVNSFSGFYFNPLDDPRVKPLFKALLEAL